VSLFSGAGGLDLGFENAGFKTVWANEFDKTIWETYRKNFPLTHLDTRSITEISPNEIPFSDGIIGGPPCQSWSEAGAGRGIHDNRGKLFFDYIRLLETKQPKFFLVENVPGILHQKHREAFSGFLEQFDHAGYNVSWRLLDAHDFGVPENRKRVFIIGIRKDLHTTFNFPEPQSFKLVLKDAIGDLDEPSPAKERNKSNGNELKVANHEYMNGGFSTIFMSRNRVRAWNEPSFTIQAGGRHAPIHPKAPKMKFVSKNVRIFEPGRESDYRRLSVRECARIQTFPDDFVFVYDDVATGYKMIGNAVPVNLAFEMALQVKFALIEAKENMNVKVCG